MEDAIRRKVTPLFISEIYCSTSMYGTMLTVFQVTESLNPTMLEIQNNSHLHAHHKAMQGSTSRETHFE